MSLTALESTTYQLTVYYTNSEILQMNDFTGTMPTEDGTQQRNSTTFDADEDPSKKSDQAAAISLQELATGSIAQPLESSLFQHQIEQDISLPWNQGWPFWGDENLMPFADGSLPFDFNMDDSFGQGFS